MTTRARDMLSTLLRSNSDSKEVQDKRRRVDSSMFHTTPNTPSAGPASRREYPRPRHATADFTEAEDDEDEESHEEEERVGELPRFTRSRHEGGPQEGEGRRSSATMIPLFSASHLGKCMQLKLVMHTKRYQTLCQSTTSCTRYGSSSRRGPRQALPGNSSNRLRYRSFWSSRCNNRSGMYT